MNRKSYLMILAAVLFPVYLLAQHSEEPIDTSFTDYDALFSDLEKFMDSITAPRSFLLFNVNVSDSYFDYDSKSSALLQSVKKLTYLPSLSYFSKSGIGICGSEAILNEGNTLKPFQAALTGSYDYLKNSHFITGISFTRFFTKSNLPFYTSPLNNNTYAYFTYKSFWIKPTVALSYGWGSRTSYTEREDLITSLLLADNGYAKLNKQETISDLNLIASVRHDFYWLQLFSKRDYMRLTPVIIFTGGTQKFGFNQTGANNASAIQKVASDYLYQSDDIHLETKTAFQPLTLSGRIKTEYAIGRFYIQPQVILEYYFPGDNNLSSGFVMSAGVIF
jgi:hypothetical protein